MRIVLLWPILALPLPAQAGIWNGRAVLAACRQTEIKIPQACREEIPPDLLATILPVADRLVRDEQVRAMKEFVHKRISGELSRSIKARRALLSCLDKPADKTCAARVGLLRAQLEKNVKRLRLALALSRVPLVPNDRSVPAELRMPTKFGATPLPRLSPAEEKEARAFQKSALAASERVGLEQLRREAGRNESVEALQKKCHRADPELLELCAKARAVHEESFLRFRESMGKIAGNIIADLPFALSFSTTPISDGELKKQLQKSLATLKAWHDDNGGADEDDDKEWGSTVLSDNLAYTEEYVAAHPEACPAAERNLRLTGYMQTAKDTLVSVRDVASVTLVCSVASPLVCISASGAVLAKDANNAYGEWAEVRHRLAAADRENPQANQVAVGDTFRDLLVAVAFDALDTASYAKWALAGGEDFYPIKDFLKTVERKPKKFYKEAGEMFSTLTENVAYDVPYAAGSAAGETAAATLHLSEPGSYGEWLRSDAYTARVYEAFDRFAGAR